MLLPLFVASTIRHQQVRPVLWLNTAGEILINGQKADARVNPGASKVKFAGGYAYNFSGAKPGILFGDDPRLRLGGSLSVSVWLFPRNYGSVSPQAEIMFRGDDRTGLDPYFLVITSDGTINFAVSSEDGRAMGVQAELPLDRWTHVVGSMDDRTGELALWENGEKVACAHTSARPFVGLDPRFSPGIGIGNVQNDHGPHNQPFNGLLADLRLFDSVVTPDEAGFPPFLSSRN